LDTYHVVLYIHLLALFVGIGAGSILILCLFQLRAARTLEAAAPWGAVAPKVARAFPVAILGLFGSGAYMTSDLWTWDTGWIVVAIVALVVLGLQGPLLAERAGKKVGMAMGQNGPGELREPALRMTRYTVLWFSELSSFGLVLGVVWNMTTKPGTGTAVAAAVGGYAVGAGLAVLFTRKPSGEHAAATEPAR
jgi:hypothetical protein